MSIIGLRVTTPNRCQRCRCTYAVLGAGRGQHRASIMCVCGKHLGWPSEETFSFITEAVRQFGRPDAPIRFQQSNHEFSAFAEKTAADPVPAQENQSCTEKENLKCQNPN